MVHYPVPNDMASVLTAPVPGEIELEIDRNDDRFDTLNEAIEKATEFYGKAQELVSKLGFYNGDPIEQTNAVDLFVTPFSGDWNQLIACGDAMTKAGTALQDVSENLLAGMAQLFASSTAGDGAWEGETANAFYAHMTIHVALFQGAGLVVKQGKLVFDGISEVAQYIAGLVVELIDTALDLAVWILERLVRYARPWIGWVQLGWDVATEGWDAVQDVIDAITDLAATVQAVFDLHDAVRSWVETIPGQLEVFQQIWGLIESIPDLGTTPILTGMEAVNIATGAAEGQTELNEKRQQAEEQAAEARETLQDQADGVEQPGVTPELEDIDVPEVEDR